MNSNMQRIKPIRFKFTSVGGIIEDVVYERVSLFSFGRRLVGEMNAIVNSKVSKRESDNGK
ncbi:hypothetical protein FJQ98_18935 [Lysinibacillus agricola]|uniref:Uncharacterized protein n=1 Tax=Lysinibacillus agricola TaxID=2590012 RepID=A0ABX7AN50_9BACI|nr:MULTISPECIES: hypothetical protein [Lysinibacillus]QQP11274.1 hypothetical protein FJQ98_18935 [Lysinibacillus agricola]